MAVDYEKLLNLDYTAYEHSQDFQDELDERQINSPSIHVEKSYDDEGVPSVVVIASDSAQDFKYINAYQLENVTKEEFEEVIFDTWKAAMKDLEL